MQSEKRHTFRIKRSNILKVQNLLLKCLQTAVLCVTFKIAYLYLSVFFRLPIGKKRHTNSQDQLYTIIQTSGTERKAADRPFWEENQINKNYPYHLLISYVFLLSKLYYKLTEHKYIKRTHQFESLQKKKNASMTLQKVL